MNCSMSVTAPLVMSSKTSSRRRPAHLGVVAFLPTLSVASGRELLTPTHRLDRACP
jgi:hypothetical protein